MGPQAKLNFVYLYKLSYSLTHSYITSISLISDITATNSYTTNLFQDSKSQDSHIIKIPEKNRPARACLINSHLPSAFCLPLAFHLVADPSYSSHCHRAHNLWPPVSSLGIHTRTQTPIFFSILSSFYFLSRSIPLSSIA